MSESLLKRAALLRAEANRLEQQHRDEMDAVKFGKTIYFRGLDPRLIVSDGNGKVLLVDPNSGVVVNSYSTLDALRNDVGATPFKVYQLMRAPWFRGA